MHNDYKMLRISKYGSELLEFVVIEVLRLTIRLGMLRVLRFKVLDVLIAFVVLVVNKVVVWKAEIFDVILLHPLTPRYDVADLDALMIVNTKSGRRSEPYQGFGASFKYHFVHQ